MRNHVQKGPKLKQDECGIPTFYCHRVATLRDGMQVFSSLLDFSEGEI